MKYAKWYFLLISRAQARDSDVVGERHHIVPQTLGGGNEKSNLVKLTYREHFLAHLLLVKFTCGEDKRKMNFALVRMTGGGGNRTRLSGWRYERARMASADARKGQKMSPESRAKVSLAKIGKPSLNKGKKRTAEHKAKISAARIGKKLTDETRVKLSAAMIGNHNKKGKPAWNKGKKHTDETRARISAARKGIGLGKKHTDETRAKMSAAHKGFGLGNKHTAETRTRMSAAHTGKKRGPMTEECKAKISAAKLGKRKGELHARI